MKKVRITAVKQAVHKRLIEKYENPIGHACEITKGQTWIAVNGQCPEGFCPAAWLSMRDFVRSLARGKGNFYDGWMKNPMSAMISCNDGFRPFSFYIEAIEEEAPVRQNKEDMRVNKLILVVGKQVLPRRQIVADLGMKQASRSIFSYNYMKPAWERGLIDFAFTDVPHKPKQAYRLTAKGLELYTQLKRAKGKDDLA